MELRQLKYFIRSAELLNFTEAAKGLFVSQSTLSQQIRQLEEELGLLLFDRIGKRVRLTEAGTLFLPYARQSVLDSDSGKMVIEDLKKLKTGELHIGVTYGLSSLLTPTLILFSKNYPDIKIVVEFGTSEDLLEKLKSAKVDMVLSFLQSKESGIFVSEPLYKSDLSLVFHRSFASLKGKNNIHLQELSSIPLVLPARGFNTRHFLDEKLTRSHIRANIKMELTDMNILLQLVETGNWCTIMTIAAVKGRKELQTIPIQGLNVSSHASITWLKDAYRKKAAITFAELVKQQDFH